MAAVLSASIVVDHFAPARRSMRIAVVTETYPPEVNGVAMSLARVVEGLHARNHAIQLVRPRQLASDGAAGAEREGEGAEAGFDEVLLRGLPIPRYPHLKMGLPSKKQLLQLWTLRRPDVVHIASEGPLGWSALQAATQLKLPVCSDFRTNFHTYSKHYGMGWLNRPILGYLRKFHNRTQHTMVPTEDLRQQLQRHGFHNVSVLARGVDTTLFHPARRSDALRASWGAGADDTVLLCVGRLAAEKNLGALLAAFDAARIADPRTRLVLVGDGPQRKELQRRCPDAVFAGVRAGEDLAAHYASSDVFVFPSLTETFGNVTPEAMASGLAVLAFDYAAAAQLIRHGDNGLLARFADSGDLTRQAVQLCADRSRARGMGLRARETACQFGWDRIVGQLEAVLQSAIDARGEAASVLALRSGT
jgi:glycosyltransferase involved in cell wall biosynthesis